MSELIVAIIVGILVGAICISSSSVASKQKNEMQHLSSALQQAKRDVSRLKETVAMQEVQIYLMEEKTVGLYGKIDQQTSMKEFMKTASVLSISNTIFQHFIYPRIAD